MRKNPSNTVFTLIITKLELHEVSRVFFSELAVQQCFFLNSSCVSESIRHFGVCSVYAEPEPYSVWLKLETGSNSSSGRLARARHRVSHMPRAWLGSRSRPGLLARLEVETGPAGSSLARLVTGLPRACRLEHETRSSRFRPWSADLIVNACSIHTHYHTHMHTPLYTDECCETCAPRDARYVMYVTCV